MRPDAPERRHDRPTVADALRWMVRAGAPWRSLPGDFPPWPAVEKQTRRWIDGGCFEALVYDRRALPSWADGRADVPMAGIMDGATRSSTPESGDRASVDGSKWRQGRKGHLADDPLGHRLARRVTPPNAPERARFGALAEAVQVATGATVPNAAGVSPRGTLRSCPPSHETPRIGRVPAKGCWREVSAT